MDRLLKANTWKSRTHSLFRQGCMLYELIPNMPEHRLLPLMMRFAENVSQCGSFSGIFEVVQNDVDGGENPRINGDECYLASFDGDLPVRVRR